MVGVDENLWSTYTAPPKFLERSTVEIAYYMSLQGVDTQSDC